MSNRKLNIITLNQFIEINYHPVSDFKTVSAYQSVIEDDSKHQLQHSFAPDNDSKKTVGYDAGKVLDYSEICEILRSSNKSIFCFFKKPKYELDKSFADMLQFWISDKNLKPSNVYTMANLNKSSFNNIINHPNVIPKKNTALACIIGLQLGLKDAEDLLKRAGYTFSDSQLTDVIVRCYIENGIYDISEINDVLYEKDLAILGSGNYTCKDLDKETADNVND